jgi:hypothetical protein
MALSDPHDTCRCGDYRRDHPRGGPCIFGSSHGIPRDQPEAHCAGFRLSRYALKSPYDTCAKCALELAE